MSRTINIQLGTPPPVVPDPSGLDIANNTALVGPAAGGYNSLTVNSGDLTISSPGLYENLDVTGVLFIQSAGVTVRGFRARGGVRHNSDNHASILQYGEIGPISGVGVINPGTGMAINPGYALLDYMNIHNGPDLTWALVGPGYTPRINHSWLHDPESPDDIDPHADCFQIAGGSGQVEIWNTFMDARVLYYTTTSLNPPAGRRLTKIANAAIQSGDFPTNGGINCYRNLFAGGSYTTQLLDATLASNWFYVVNNCWYGRGTQIWTESGSPVAGAFPLNGPYSNANSRSDHFTWSNVKYADLTGGVWVPAEPVPGP